ncbi:hypothetical protein Nepgr_015730 [Nepenthes gracilis]|uniref:Uncharacterized protein n=1 Tax=Nepenthes gracilis TaxID=150966 RepID=A0AAD3XRD2_NEPGR|nr:hypothetical protein Nepgr_015730 [Nepenthes gracilis]
MRSYFDVENLPSEFGGKATLEYDHEEFSKSMAEDDIKAAKFWGFGDQKNEKIANGHFSADVVPEPVVVAPTSN